MRCLHHESHYDALTQVANIEVIACPATSFIDVDPHTRICYVCRASYTRKTLFLCWVLRHYKVVKDIVKVIIGMVQHVCHCPFDGCNHFVCFECKRPPVYIGRLFHYRAEQAKELADPPREICVFCWFDGHLCWSCRKHESDHFGPHYMCRECHKITCSICSFIIYCQSELCVCTTCFSESCRLACDTCDRDIDPRKTTGAAFNDHGFCEDGGDVMCCGCSVYDDVFEHDADRCMKTGCMGLITTKRRAKKLKE